MSTKDELLLNYCIDSFGPGLFSGWVLPKDPQSMPVSVRLRADDKTLAVMDADLSRQDVLDAGYHSKLCGFEFQVNSALLGEMKTWEIWAGDKLLCGKTVSDIHGDPGQLTHDNYYFSLERKSINCVKGWVMHSEESSQSVTVDVLAGGKTMFSTLADKLRNDIADSGLWSSECGFEMELDGEALVEEGAKALCVRFNNMLMATISPTELEIVGEINLIGERFILGWAHDLSDPDLPLTIEFINVENGKVYPVNQGLNLKVYIPELLENQVGSGYMIDLDMLEESGKYRISVQGKVALFSDIEFDIILSEQVDAETLCGSVEMLTDCIIGQTDVS